MGTLMRGDTSTLSLREKALVKRRVTKEHNSNFRAGYVHIDEEQLHKTGIRGRKTYFVYLITAALVFMVIVNLMVTLVILATLKISKDGMSALEFIPPSILTRFIGDSVFNEVHPFSNTIGSLHDQHLEVSGNDSKPVILKVNINNEPEIRVSTNTILLDNTEAFMVVDPDTGKTVFTTDFEEQIPLPESVNNLRVKRATVNSIKSLEDGDLTLSSEESISVRGSEGITSESKNANINSAEDLMIEGERGIHLSHEENGIYLKRELTFIDDRGRPPTDEVTYKICVSVPSGQLFVVPSGESCSTSS